MILSITDMACPHRIQSGVNQAVFVYIRKVTLCSSAVLSIDFREWTSKSSCTPVSTGTNGLAQRISLHFEFWLIALEKLVRDWNTLGLSELLIGMLVTKSGPAFSSATEVGSRMCPTSLEHTYEVLDINS